MLEQRSKQSREGFIKQAFIKKILQEEGKEMMAEVTARMAQRNFQGASWYTSRKIEVTEDTMKYSHLPEHRFVDMRTRQTKKGKINKKSHPIHNRVVFGHMNNIIRRLQFEYTDGIKDQLRNEFKI